MTADGSEGATRDDVVAAVRRLVAAEAGPGTDYPRMTVSTVPS